MDVYKRKISDEEAQGQYILILKDALNFFPKIGKPFKLKISGKEGATEKQYDVIVNAVTCWCMGPNKPHSHYRIDAKIFRDSFAIHFGKKIEIKKDADNEYSLK